MLLRPSTLLRSWLVRCDMLRYMIPATENIMSSSKKTPTQPPRDPLDEALEETFPASDPIAVDPPPQKHAHSNDAKKKGHEAHHHGGKH